MACDVVGRAIDAVGIARLGARIDRQFEQPIDGLHIRRFGLADADLAEIEYGDLQSDVEPAHQKTLVGSLFQLIGVTAIEDIDKPRRLGEAVGLASRSSSIRAICRSTRRATASTSTPAHV